MSNCAERVEKTGLIAILRRVPEEKLIRTCRALYEGGVRVLEVTFDHASNDCMQTEERLLRTLRAEFGDSISIGAGTVLTADEVRLCADCGAELIVSPNTDTDVICETKRLGMLSYPGAMTPTEIVTARNAGADAVKLFPAEQLGIPYLKALRGPLGHIPLLVVGGVDENNAGDFIKAGAKGVGVGGKLVRADLIERDDYDALRDLAAKYIEALQKR